MRRTEDGLYESELGPVEVGPPELVDGIELTPGLGRQPARGRRRAIPSRIGELGPRLETHPRFPERTNVQVVRVDGPGEVTARVWERGVGETARPGRARSRSRPRRTATARSSSTSPAATCACASRTAGRGSPGRPNRSTNCRAPATKPARTRSGFPDIVADEGGGRATPPLGGGVARRPARTLGRLRCRSRTRAARR